MKVLFHANEINLRGTTVAIADYAKYNQEILGNESVLGYFEDAPKVRDGGTEKVALRHLQEKFEIRPYSLSNIESSMHDIDFGYFLRSGQKEILPTNIKCGVHSVFQFKEPHGDVYAYISAWLSNKMSGGSIPYVPHVVMLPEPKKDYRSFFGIRKDQIVIGRLGGLTSFDIPFVKNEIIEILNTNSRYVFLFLNTDVFIHHPNVKYLRATVDPLQKANFINTCDGFIHAREKGESFGLAICESLYLNKPVLAFNGGEDQHHIDLLKNTDLLYGCSNLKEKIISIKDFKGDYRRLVEQFNPKEVMNKFDKVFLA